MSENENKNVEVEMNVSGGQVNGMVGKNVGEININPSGQTSTSNQTPDRVKEETSSENKWNLSNKLALIGIIATLFVGIGAWFISGLFTQEFKDKLSPDKEIKQELKK